MNNDYVAEILRATGTLQSGDPAGVTAIIQNALAAAGLVGSVDAGPSGNPNPGLQLPQALTRGAWRRTPSAADRSDAETAERSHPHPAIRWKGLGLEGMPGLRPACAHSGTAVARRRPVPRSALFLRGGRAPLPALCSVHRRRRPAGTDRDAARLHAEPGRLRRRDRDERPGRRAPAAHRLSGADRRRQFHVLLELVPAR